MPSTEINEPLGVHRACSSLRPSTFRTTAPPEEREPARRNGWASPCPGSSNSTRHLAVRKTGLGNFQVVGLRCRRPMGGGAVEVEEGC